jgi:hypothetical protein
MDHSDGAMAVVTSLRRSGIVTDADLRHRGAEKKATAPHAGDSAVDFGAALR